MQEHNAKTIRRLAAAAVILTLMGTAGFAMFEHIPLGNALYETIIILLTHYDHFGVTDPVARGLVVVLILSSLGLIAYLLKWLAEYMMGISSNVRRLRVKSKVDKMKGHYIVCGLGRVGSQVAGEMYHEGVSFVGLDRDPVKVDDALAKGYNALPLDSTTEEALQQVGIEKATGLVACLAEDSLNLFVTLAARSLNPDLYIVARANRPENELKLKRAGADRVAMPYQIGGYHMASMALRPNVVDYMDIMSKSGAAELEVEEMVVVEGSKLAGHRLGKTLAEGEVGATVIAINGADGTSRVRPTGKEVIYVGDRLIILGSKPDLTAASELIR
ncbi:MAG: TrkA-N protein [Patescibacteria group bacterium]|nr:TrkA-N protein [Patescibacteria group bacterium]